MFISKKKKKKKKKDHLRTNKGRRQSKEGGSLYIILIDLHTSRVTDWLVRCVWFLPACE